MRPFTFLGHSLPSALSFYHRVPFYFAVCLFICATVSLFMFCRTFGEFLMILNGLSHFSRFRQNFDELQKSGFGMEKKVLDKSASPPSALSFICGDFLFRSFRNYHNFKSSTELCIIPDKVKEYWKSYIFQRN